MNYKNIYKSICNQIRKKYLQETVEMSPMPSDGGGGQYFYPMGPPDQQTPSTSPTWVPSDSNPQPVTPKPNGHMGNPNFHQFPISPNGLPIEVWVFDPNPSPYGSFQLFRLNGEGQYTPHGAPIKLREWVDYGPANPIERNPNIPVVIPYPGMYPNGDFPNPVFGPGIQPDPEGLNWPPGFNPNFWQNQPDLVLPPGWGVTPTPYTPDAAPYPGARPNPGLNDPYEGVPHRPHSPGGLHKMPWNPITNQPLPYTPIPTIPPPGGGPPALGPTHYAPGYDPFNPFNLPRG